MNNLSALSRWMMCILLAISTAGAYAQEPEPVDITGSWIMIATGDPLIAKGNLPGACRWQGSARLVQTEGAFTGTATLVLTDGPPDCVPTQASADLSGIIKGSVLAATAAVGPLGSGSFTGSLATEGADSMQGSFLIEQGPFVDLNGTWSATRGVAAPEIPAQSGLGMVLLVLLLVSAAVAVLWRRRLHRAR